MFDLIIVRASATKHVAALRRRRRDERVSVHPAASL
jgi:hypothetical protein